MRELVAVLLLLLILNVNAAIDVWLRAGSLNVSDVPESLVSATMHMKQEGFEAELQTQPIPRIDTLNFKMNNMYRLMWSQRTQDIPHCLEIPASNFNWSNSIFFTLEEKPQLDTAYSMKMQGAVRESEAMHFLFDFFGLCDDPAVETRQYLTNGFLLNMPLPNENRYLMDFSAMDLKGPIDLFFRAGRKILDDHADSIMPELSGWRRRLAYGGFSNYDDLQSVQSTVDCNKANFLDFLKSQNIVVDQNAKMEVISAQSALAAGTWFKIRMNVGAFKNVIIKYFIALPYANPDQIPSDFELIDRGTSDVSQYFFNPIYMGTSRTPLADDSDVRIGEPVEIPETAHEGVKLGGYSVVNFDDLGPIRTTIDSIKDEIIALFRDKGYDVEANQEPQVLSAKRQVVAGMNYQVTVQIGPCIETVQYFIPLPGEDPQRRPQNLRMVTGTRRLAYEGFSVVKSGDLGPIRTTIDGIKDEIIALFRARGYHIEANQDVQVLSAKHQVVAGGMNYQVTVQVGIYWEIVQYLIPLPSVDPQRKPQSLRIIQSRRRRLGKNGGEYHFAEITAQNEIASLVDAVSGYKGKEARRVLLDNVANIEIGEEGEQRVNGDGVNRRGLSALTQEELQGFIDYHQGLISAAITIKNERGSVEDK